MRVTSIVLHRTTKVDLPHFYSEWMKPLKPSNSRCTLHWLASLSFRGDMFLWARKIFAANHSFYPLRLIIHIILFISVPIIIISQLNENSNCIAQQNKQKNTHSSSYRDKISWFLQLWPIHYLWLCFQSDAFTTRFSCYLHRTHYAVKKALIRLCIVWTRRKGDNFPVITLTQEDQNLF